MNGITTAIDEDRIGRIYRSIELLLGLNDAWHEKEIGGPPFPEQRKEVGTNGPFEDSARKNKTDVGSLQRQGEDLVETAIALQIADGSYAKVVPCMAPDSFTQRSLTGRKFHVFDIRDPMSLGYVLANVPVEVNESPARVRGDEYVQQAALDVGGIAGGAAKMSRNISERSPGQVGPWPKTSDGK